MTKLDELRSHIRELDGEILRLFAERTQVAREIGEEKKAANIPLRDWDVERQVLDLAASRAGELGLPEAAVRSLMQLLISTSRDEQERLSYSTYRGAAEDIVIIGGRGKMGRWFADFFGNQGHRVNVHDVAQEHAGDSEAAGLDELLKPAAFALIATPPEVIPDVIERLIALSYQGTAFDISSLKGHLKPAIVRAANRGLAYTSIHPMFGPGARALADQVVCICDCGNKTANRSVTAFFADTAATLVNLSLDEHDRIVSIVLGLSHLMNLLFTRVLMESGWSMNELNRVGSTTFHSQMVTTSTVIRDNPQLYYTIQKLNPFTPQMHATLKRELEQLTAWVHDDNQAAFVNMMNAGRRWMIGDDQD